MTDTFYRGVTRSEVTSQLTSYLEGFVSEFTGTNSQLGADLVSLFSYLYVGGTIDVTIEVLGEVLSD